MRFLLGGMIACVLLPVMVRVYVIKPLFLLWKHWPHRRGRYLLSGLHPCTLSLANRLYDFICAYERKIGISDANHE